MYGAIFGDIIGSRFEFDRGGKTREFELFTGEDEYTDDTVMSVAVGEALMRVGKEASVEEIHEAVTRAMVQWGHRYPQAGYGGRFYTWLFGRGERKPYNSYGNGSAMRVSAAGWLYDSLERTREVARATADATHNHPEGIKGAECTAAVMYLGRIGTDKEEIREYVIREFGYDLSESLDQLRHRHEHVESCQDSLPKALTSFFEGNSYEEVVRNAVSLGGDTDTLGAIAGAMAEAYYGVPVGILAQGLPFLPEDMLDVLREFDIAIGRVDQEREALYEKNEIISRGIRQFTADRTEANLLALFDALLQRMLEGGEVPVPMVDVNQAMDTEEIEGACIGDMLQLKKELVLRPDVLEDGEGKRWMPLYTNEEESAKLQGGGILMNVRIRTVLEKGLVDNDLEGVVFNPFSEALRMPKEILEILLKRANEILSDEIIEG